MVIGLVPALEAAGLPAPLEVSEIPVQGGHARFQLRFPPELQVPRHIVRVERDSRPRPSVGVELAAMNLARPVLPVPTARPLPGLPRPALIYPSPKGEIDSRNRKLPGLMVDLLLALNSISAEQWGDAVVDGIFVPTEASWGRYIHRRIDQAWASATTAGCGLGSLADSLREAATRGLSALDGVPCCLVHGDVIPSNLVLGPDAELICLLDWDEALLGDPLMDWVPAFEAPSGALMAGLDRRRPEVLTGPGASERLQTYQRLRALERLAECGRAWLDGDGGRRRSGLIEAARVLAHAALEPKRIPSQLAALQGTGAAPSPRKKPTSATILRRRALEALRYPIEPHALALASTLAATADDTGLLAEQSSRFLRGTGPQRQAWAPAPIADRIEWRSTLLSEVCIPSAPGVAWALLALGLGAVDAVAGEVSDGTLRGLARQIAMVDVAQPTWRDAAVGYAAAVELGIDPQLFAELLGTVPEQPQADPEDATDGLVFVDWLEKPDAVWVPLLAWSLRHLPSPLDERVAGQLIG